MLFFAAVGLMSDNTNLRQIRASGVLYYLGNSLGRKPHKTRRQTDMQYNDAPLDVRVVGSTVVLCGEVDISTAPMMEKAMFDCIDQGNETLVVDFERVTYFDSSGIQALLRARLLLQWMDA